MDSIADRVKEIITVHLGVDEDRVHDGARFAEDLGADSLDRVEIVMAFEDEFSIEITDDQAEGIETFKDAVEFVERATS